ncbi:MAG: hypothetical protein JW864_16505 [Spirochaetes bacterium]|nr:hypothetical protein [Spirochaetota bacterium]
MSNSTGLLFATDMEADPFISGFALSVFQEKPFKVYNSGEIYLIVSGIGKAYAAMAAAFLIREYSVNRIFNIGAAGAAKSGIKLGDMFHINKVIEYDRPRLFKKGLRIVKPDVLEGYKTTSLATQDIPVIAVEHRKEMSQYADLVDMEGAAVVQACRLFGARSYLFKYVTDTPEYHETDIINNINLFGKNIFNLLENKIKDNP